MIVVHTAIEIWQTAEVFQLRDLYTAIAKMNTMRQVYSFLSSQDGGVGSKKSCITSVPSREPLITWKSSHCTAQTQPVCSCRKRDKEKRDQQRYSKTISHAKSAMKNDLS